MGNNTKIVILKAKELIYTLIFAALGILLILLLLFMFSPKEDKTAADVMQYVPGVYTSTVSLGESTLNVQVTVDSDTIKNVSLINVDESVTTMYPLLETAIDEINAQISTVSSVDDITYSRDNQYTTIILNQAIKSALEKASAETSTE